MILLTIRTDKPEAELGIYDGQTRCAYYSWLAHRQLAETLHATIHAMLETEQYGLEDLQGVVVFKGPGSFTGLRIGASVANALADSLDIPIVSTAAATWLEDGITRLSSNENEKIVIPEYGAPARVTQQKK